jgi:hypothetical protein
MSFQPLVTRTESATGKKWLSPQRLAKVILVLVLLWSVVWLGMQGAARVQGMSPKNRFALYEIRGLVQPNMTVQELQGLLPHVERKGLDHRWGGSGLSIWANVGLMRSYYLLIEIRDGHVAHASIRDGEGGGRVADAPPDF